MIVPVLFSIWDMAFALIVGLLGASACIALYLTVYGFVRGYFRNRQDKADVLKELRDDMYGLEKLVKRSRRKGKK